MGVERCDYVMLAAKFDFDDFEEIIGEDNFTITDKYDDNPYEDAISSCNGLTMVRDGMNGEYAFFGHVVAKSIDSGLEPIKLDEIIDGAECLERSIKEEAEKLGIQLPFFKVHVYVFTHWH